jgi:DNA-binding NtrC family response regulator
VTNATQLLDELKDDQIHILLLSLSLPDMKENATAFLEIVSVKSPNTCVIIVADAEDAPTAYQCLAEGADDFLVAPLRAAQVKDIWSNVWRKKRERKTLDLLNTEREECDRKDRILKGLVSDHSGLFSC